MLTEVQVELSLPKTINQKEKKNNQSYADVASNGPTYNTKRGENMFNHLNY